MKHKIQVRLTSSAIEFAKKLAKEERVTVSDICRQAITEFLEAWGYEGKSSDTDTTQCASIFADGDSGKVSKGKSNRRSKDGVGVNVG